MKSRLAGCSGVKQEEQETLQRSKGLGLLLKALLEKHQGDAGVPGEKEILRVGKSKISINVVRQAGGKRGSEGTHQKSRLGEVKITEDLEEPGVASW